MHSILPRQARKRKRMNSFVSQARKKESDGRRPSATPFIIRGADDEWFYGLYDDPKSYNAGELATLPPLKRYLIERIGLKLAEDGNPPIVKIRFKTEK